MNLNVDYTIYVDNTKKLIRTMVINSAQSANIINGRMDGLGYGRDIYDKSTWKYYMNMAGIYHPSNDPMQVKSLDNGQLIDFTRENMEIHVSTKRSYQYGTDYYKALVAQYPYQIALIKGILNPIDLSVSTTAEDWQILYYDKTLVEDGEENLIPRFQEWVNTLITQTYLPDYVYITEDLMHHFYLSLIGGFGPGVILGIRLENIKTNRAHSFHIWSHILSHADIEQYRPYLNRKQILYLYRNIVWHTRNPGAQYSFQKMIDAFLTERRIPLQSYNAQHNTSSILTKIKPEVEFKRELLNMQDAIANVNYVRSTREILEDEVPLAKNNADVYEDRIGEVIQDVGTNRNSNLPTKVLESNMRDLSDSLPFSHSLTLLNEWVRLSSTGMYTAVITTTNPNTGLTMTMTVKEAFILYLYGVWQSHGVNLETIPTFRANMVMKIPRPQFAFLKAQYGSQHVTDEFIKYALNLCPDIPAIISTETFYAKTLEINAATQLHRDLYSYRNHYHARAEFEALAFGFYQDQDCDINSGMTYKEFFKQKGWDFTDLPPEEWVVFANKVSSIATGLDTANQQKLADIQQAMLGLTMQLSSYTIQVIRKINEEAVVMLDWPTLRGGDMHMKVYQQWHLVDNPVRPIDTHMREKKTYNLIHDFPKGHNSVERSWRFYIDTARQLSSQGINSRYNYLNGARMRLWTADDAAGTENEFDQQMTVKDLQGLWIDPYGDARPPADFSAEVLNGLWTDPLPGIAPIVSSLGGLWIDGPKSSGFDEDLNGLHAEVPAALQALRNTPGDSAT
ncbi:putative virion structural protein [Erwinia phage Rebecca]|uniref:Putative virion structural protein n=1 Tax=Erwinia phage Rebecca TaxID=2530026 RepID=A0A482ICN6_9CAUD|nr:putative virion structural protein [Erwinia phage Rebecca]